MLRGAAVLAVILAILWYGHKQKQAGKDEGKQEAGNEWSKQLETARQKDREELDRRIQDADRIKEEAQQRFQAAVDREGQYLRTIQGLSAQRTSAAQTVVGLADSALHGYIVQQLGLRTLGDNAPCYLPVEERTIAKAIVDAPLCQKQNDALGQQIGELKQQVKAVQDKQAATEQKVSALVDYTIKVESAYTTLYNAFPRKAKTAKCLWLWSCGKPKPLSVPSPQNLLQAKPI